MARKQTGNATLDEDAVVAIRELAAIGVRHEYLAGMFGVTRGYISNVVCRRTWKDI